MTPSNFDWFIHTFYHTKYLIKRQHIKKQKKEATETEDDDLGLDEVSEEESDQIIYKWLKKCTIVYVFCSI